MRMRVKLVVPSGILLEQEAVKVVAEAQDGAFCLLPRHIDYVAALVPGILGLTAADGEETFVAVDEGILVKHGPEVRISTWNALQGKLGELREGVLGRLREVGEEEQKARLALDRLEASLVHQVREWER
mgnify:CR=1 FL=1|jgi:F-type H+-transporting ATPase subunit epsilon